MGNASKHFNYSEFKCPCGCGMGVKDTVLVLAELIRQHEGNKPITPNSAARCREYNEIIQHRVNALYVPYSSHSKHIEGIACDWPSSNPKKLYDFLDNLFPNTFGIGVYNTFVHIDTRNNKARWDNRG